MTTDRPSTRTAQSDRKVPTVMKGARRCVNGSSAPACHWMKTYQERIADRNRMPVVQGRALGL